MRSVWIIKQHGTLPNSAGGTRQYDLAVGLAQKGYDVTFIISGFDHHKKKYEVNFNGRKFNKIVISGVNVLRIKTFPYYKNNWRRVVGSIDFAFKLIWLVKGYWQKKLYLQSPDVIMVTSVPLFAPLCVALLRHFFNAIFVLEVTDIWPQVLADMGQLKKDNVFYKLMKILELYLYHAACIIISPFPAFQNYLRKYRVQNKLHWVGRGVIEPKAIIAEDFLDNESFNIVYMGAIGPANGLDSVINAFNILKYKNKKICLHLYGDGIDKKKLIKKIKVKRNPNVIFHNPVPKSEVQSTLANSDALLLAGKPIAVHQFGIFPNKLADYLWAGKPIITIEGIDSDLVATLGCGRTVPYNRPRNLADAITQIANLPLEERIKMGQAARDYARENLKMEQMIDNFELALKRA
jgi:glycosyltransferase involved in cell wall biosynthesis